MYEEPSPESGGGCVHFTNNDCSEVGQGVMVLLQFGKKLLKANTPKAIGFRIAPGGLKWNQIPLEPGIVQAHNKL